MDVVESKFDPEDAYVSITRFDKDGKAHHVNIYDVGEWDALIRHMQHTVFKHKALGWESGVDIEHVLRSRRIDVPLEKLAAENPRQFAELVSALEVALDKALRRQNTGALTALALFAGKVEDATEEKARELALELVRSADDESLRRFQDILSDWSLIQVTAAAREVKRRLQVIDMFSGLLKDEQTYEIKGNSSIHSLFEQDMWLLDESYWLLQSNRTLKTFIGENLPDRIRKEYGGRRPDFCVKTLGNKLVIVELKRPSHNLCVEDLNQLESYLVISEEFSSQYSDFEGYLLGDSIGEVIARHSRHRHGMRVMTYWEVLANARERYSKYRANSAETSASEE